MQAIKDLIPPVIDKLDLLPEPEDQKEIEPVTLTTLDTSHEMVKEAVAAARRWQRRKRTHPRASLVLTATHTDQRSTGKGVGKTHIARAIFWSERYVSLDTGEVVGSANKFYEADDIVSRLNDKETMYQIVGSSPVLVIDDVGTEKTLKYISAAEQKHEMASIYFQIVNYCYVKNISLVLTANLSLDELAQHVGGRAWSRLLEMAPGGQMLDLTGVPDYRRLKGGR